MLKTVGINFGYFLLEGVSMEFGAMVSTSNTYDGSPTVTINNSDPILWSMSMKNYKS